MQWYYLLMKQNMKITLLLTNCWPNRSQRLMLLLKGLKKFKNFPITTKKKEKLFTEFKSVLLDKEYQIIKICMLEHIDSLNFSIIYSVYKDDNKFDHGIKEKIYIQLLNNIISNIDTHIDIIFDTFNKKDFEKKSSNHNHLILI